ncbi:unnamed protein product [Trichobilharzia regenti]|nr:unnamed protein product [Trichobilharzia regenti]
MKALLTVITEVHGGACEYIDDLEQKVSERLRIIRLFADEVIYFTYMCTYIIYLAFVSYIVADNMIKFIRNVTKSLKLLYNN